MNRRNCCNPLLLPLALIAIGGNFCSFSASSNVRAQANSLDAPVPPTSAAVEAKNGYPDLVFNQADSADSFSNSHSASGELLDLLQSDSYEKRQTSANAKHIESANRRLFSLSEDPAKLQDELQLTNGAVVLAVNTDLRTVSSGDAIQLQQFGKSRVFTITSARTTGNGSTFILGKTDNDETISLLISTSGSAVGRITLTDDVWQISPTGSTGVVTLTSSSTSQLRAMPFGDDMRVSAQPSRPAHSAQFQVSSTTSSTISVLMLYDPNLPDPVATVEYLLQLTNQIQTDSGTGIIFEATSYRSFVATSTPLDTITDSTQVQTWRDQEKADLVAWVGSFNTNYGYCGEAWVPGANGQDFASQVAELGYSVTLYGSSGSTYCPEETLAHEFGHNLGAAHDRANSGTLTPYYPYAYGDGVGGTFGTVMSYLEPEVGKYSSPLLSCPTRPCGQENYTDVVRALNNVRQIVADIYQGVSVTSAPTAPIINEIQPGNEELTVRFTPGDTGGLAVTYLVACGDSTTSTSGNVATVSGLQNEVPVSCTVTASNAKGSVTSAAVVATPESSATGLPIWLLYEATKDR